MNKMRQSYRKPDQMPEPASPSFMLRAEDIRAMIADGSIENQHFLIRILASGFPPIQKPKGGT